MSAKSNTAVLLLAHGTPGSAEDVPAYMQRVTAGRQLPEAVIKEVQHRYGLIGKSPLTEITLQQAEALSKQLDIRCRKLFTAAIENALWKLLAVPEAMLSPLIMRSSRATWSGFAWLTTQSVKLLRR